MKTKPQAAIFAAAIAFTAIAATPCFAQGNSGKKTFPASPSGWLNATPTVVQAGTHPTITWGINYPSIVEDYITVTSPSTLTAKVDVDCEIRILGAGVTISSSGGSGYTFIPTEAQVSYDGQGYTRIFYGTNLSVNPNTVVYTKTILKNKKLRFGGRYYYNKQWSNLYKSDGGTQNIRTLINGSVPPSNIPQYNAPSLENFIKPYLSPSNIVQIGPMDVIVFMELTHSDSQSNNVGYDLQDMVLLVTFKSKAKNNNGHGNNLDGIDSSNPGNAPFINLDTDPNIDDER